MSISNLTNTIIVVFTILAITAVLIMIVNWILDKRSRRPVVIDTVEHYIEKLMEMPVPEYTYAWSNGPYLKGEDASRKGSVLDVKNTKIITQAILYKRFIVEVLRNGIDISGRPLSFFVDNLISEFEKHNICDQGTYEKKEAWKAVLEELVDNNGKTSLTKMGLLRITINDDIKIPGNPKWSLSAEEVRTICDEFLLSMLSNAAVTQSKVPLTKEDNEDYTHGGVLSAFTYSDTDAKKRRKAFIPTRQGLSNKRLDYIKKIAAKSGMPEDDASCITLLKGIWDHLLINKDRNILTLEDGAYRVNAESLSFKEGKKWYICPKCKTITCNNVKGVCPTYKCEGELEPIDIKEQFSGNHYYEMYQNLEMRPLRIVEHTAQLSRDWRV